MPRRSQHIPHKDQHCQRYLDSIVDENTATTTVNADDIAVATEQYQCPKMSSDVGINIDQEYWSGVPDWTRSQHVDSPTLGVQTEYHWGLITCII
jgi:hypothetical protein